MRLPIRSVVCRTRGVKGNKTEPHYVVFNMEKTYRFVEIDFIA